MEDNFSPEIRPVTVIIPAYNEENTIAGVVKSIEGHPLINEILIVDDGSTDETYARAKETSARVLRLKKNSGKASAMNLGVKHSNTSIIVFLDADIDGLTYEIIDRIALPVVQGRYDMFVVGISSYDFGFTNRLRTILPIIAGLRALKKEWWFEVPEKYKRNFQIEMALNYFVTRKGGRMGFEIVPDIQHITKEKKRGIVKGFFERMDMIDDIIGVMFDLYLIRDYLKP